MRTDCGQKRNKIDFIQKYSKKILTSSILEYSKVCLELL